MQDLYVRYLLAQPKGDGCSHMAEILKDVFHDSINRFLLRERYEPKDLFDLLVANGWIELVGGTVSADDTVLEKLYSNPKKMDLQGYFWSSKHGKPDFGNPLNHPVLHKRKWFESAYQLSYL